MDHRRIFKKVLDGTWFNPLVLNRDRSECIFSWILFHSNYQTKSSPL